MHEIGPAIQFFTGFFCHLGMVKLIELNQQPTDQSHKKISFDAN